MVPFSFYMDGIRVDEVIIMENDFDYNSISVSSTGNELYAGVAPEEPTKPVVAEEAKVDEVSTEEPEDNDNPFAEVEEAKSEPEDEDDETFKKLELEEKWRTKRLNKEIEAKKQAEAEAQKLKAELEDLKKNGSVQKPADDDVKFDDAKFKQALIEGDAEIRELQNRVEQIKNSKDSYDTMGEYADALAEAQADLKIEIKDRKRDFMEYQKQSQANQNNEVSKILDVFNSKVEALKEDIPMIDKAKALIEDRAADLHVDIRRALLTDDNAGELTWAIGSSKKNLEFLVQASKIAERTGQSPVDALKMMGKWSTEIEHSKSTKAVKEPIKPVGVPKTLRSKPVAHHDDMDPYEYASKLLSGKIKNDLY